MIFGFGKKKRPRTTFKEQVAEFWEWYEKVADRLYETIEQGRCESLFSEVNAVATKTLPNLSWVFGPGENGGHSFTLSGEGQVSKQLLTEYWLTRAPKIPHWTFYSSRQPAPPDQLTEIAIRVGDQEQVDAEGFLVKTSIDKEAKAIDIIAWHPAPAQVPQDHHLEILFLLLDQTLGEFGTQTWLGEIKIEPFAASEGTKSLASLPTFIEQVSKQHKWEKLPPLESYAVYKIPEQSKSPRGDSVVGSSCIPNLIFEFLENKGRLAEDPLDGTGAEFAYLAIDGSVFPAGRQSDVRGDIEDAIGDALQREWSGRTLGGAFGLHNSYIDLILFDGDNSRHIVQTTLANLKLQDRSKICSFV